MYSELEDTEKERYLTILKKSDDYSGLLQYENCKAYLTKTSMIKINKTLSNLVQNTKYDKVSRILPIIVSSEIEKVQLFDLITTKSQESRLIYIPSPTENVGLYYHVYNCIIEELGLPLLEEISKRIQAQEIRRTRCVRALIDYYHDEKKRDAVIRWFLGEELSSNDKTILGFEETIGIDENALEMIKIIGNFSNEVIILYFDDIESPYEKYGDRAEISILELIKRLHHDVKQLIIIMACAKTAWSTILSLADDGFISILGPEQEFYDLSQLKMYIAKIMEDFWLENRVKPPSNKYFPLNDKLLNIIFEQSKGDIRRLLKLYIETINKFVIHELIL